MTLVRFQRAAIVVALGAFLSAPAVSWSNIVDADAAYDSGDQYGASLKYSALAKQGNSAAQTALARMYLEGQGVPKDFQAAARLYGKAADQGYATAQYQLAQMLFRGVGGKSDPVRALGLMEASADQGVVWAMEALGTMYRRGEGVQKDFIQAHKWFSLVALKSEPVAAEYVSRAKLAKAEVEKMMSAEQLSAAQKLASDWRGAKKPLDTEWQKRINRPVPVAAPPSTTAESKDGESALSRAYYPQN